MTAPTRTVAASPSAPEWVSVTPSASNVASLGARVPAARRAPQCGGVLEQDLVEPRARHLVGLRARHLPGLREVGVLIGLAVGGGEAGAPLLRRSRRRPPPPSAPISARTSLIQGSCDSPMWKRGKALALEHEHAVAATRERAGGGRSGGPASDHGDVEVPGLRCIVRSEVELTA